MTLIKKLLKRFTFFSYNFRASEYLENFLISAAAAVVFIRIYLEITDFPKVGSSQIHIAHMLWGGVLMMLALVIMLLFLNKESKHLAAILGGIGFGTFIDELGKFVTHDNNYFFQPTFALLYIIFVSLFLIFRLIAKKVDITDKDYKLNALEMSKEVVFYNLDTQEKQLALNYLNRVSKKDEVFTSIKNLINSIPASQDEEVQFIARIKNYFRSHYLKVFRKKWFAQTISFVFAFYSISRIFNTFSNLSFKGLSFWDWGSVISTTITGFLSIWGIYFLGRRKRLKAYEKFKQAVLVAIFLGHFFSFYHNQLMAGWGLAVTISIFIALQTLIEQEKALKKEKV
jgi:hypothetical protein